jgi:transcriptional regulator with XRE-family HTH domain
MEEKKIEELKAHFRKLGITQEQIAEKMGVSQAYVGMLLNGKKPFGKRQAMRFGELFGISPSWLLTYEGSMLQGCTDDNVPADDTKDGDIVQRLLDELKAAREQNARLLRLLELKMNMEYDRKTEGDNSIQD